MPRRRGSAYFRETVFDFWYFFFLSTAAIAVAPVAAGRTGDDTTEETTLLAGEKELALAVICALLGMRITRDGSAAAAAAAAARSSPAGPFAPLGARRCGGFRICMDCPAAESTPKVASAKPLGAMPRDPMKLTPPFVTTDVEVDPTPAAIPPRGLPTTPPGPIAAPANFFFV